LLRIILVLSSEFRGKPCLISVRCFLTVCHHPARKGGREPRSGWGKVRSTLPIPSAGSSRHHSVAHIAIHPLPLAVAPLRCSFAPSPFRCPIGHGVGCFRGSSGSGRARTLGVARAHRGLDVACTHELDGLEERFLVNLSFDKVGTEFGIVL
jgi:hypothetical protein